MILIDFSGYIHRAVHTSRAEIEEDIGLLAHKILNMILDISSQFGSSKQNPLVLAIDSKPTWRKAYYEEHKMKFPEYKGTKDDPEAWRTYKGNRVKDPTIPWDKIYEMTDDVLEVLRQHSDFHVVTVPETEADDIIAVLAKECLAQGQTCWVVSSDKDFKQIQNEPYITIYDPMKKVFVPALNTKWYKEVHCMQGDTSDNILGIRPRMGEKTAEKLHSTLQQILATDPNARERYEFNSVLIDLDRIPDHLQENIRALWDKEEHSFNGMSLLKGLSKYSLNAICERIIEFKLVDKHKATKLNSYHKTQTDLQEYSSGVIGGFFGDD
jgi:5'-3' exonuclease